jgi:hypothetical protein
MCGAKDEWSTTPPVNLPQVGVAADSGLGLNVQPFVCGCGAVTLMTLQDPEHE